MTSELHAQTFPLGTGVRYSGGKYRPYTTAQVEEYRIKAEAEAQRRREAIARGEPIEADYVEIVE